MDRPMNDMLAEYLEQQASWRAEKAREFPSDRRNAVSAASLSRLAEEVKHLPSETPALVELADLHRAWGTDVFMPTEGSAHMISRYGFGQLATPVDVFLVELAETMERERRDLQLDASEQELWSPEVDPLLGEMDDKDSGS
jgi:hypothetical protein